MSREDGEFRWGLMPDWLWMLAGVMVLFVSGGIILACLG
jgi:hypothetical protein